MLNISTIDAAQKVLLIIARANLEEIITCLTAIRLGVADSSSAHAELAGARAYQQCQQQEHTVMAVVLTVKKVKEALAVAEVMCLF